MLVSRTSNFQGATIRPIVPRHRPGSYVVFLPCRMQFKQKVMKQIISLSIVSNAFDTAEMRRMNRAYINTLLSLLFTTISSAR